MLDGKLCLENLFKQFALVHGGRWTDAKALATLQEEDLIGVLRGEIELVSDDYHGVAAGAGQAAQRFE